MSTPSQPQPQAPPVSTQFPLNRVVAFLGPFVAIVAGALASWLGQHFPGLHLNKGTTSAQIAQVIEFAIAAAGTLALQHKWLTGWQQWEALTTPPASTQPALPGLPSEASVLYPGLAPVSGVDMLYPPDAFPPQPPLDAPASVGAIGDPQFTPGTDPALPPATEDMDAYPVDAGVAEPEGAGQAGDG